MNRSWLNISLIFLFVAAFLGSLLRLMSFQSVGINYSFLLHAHSHIAFLGWLYNVLFVILLYAFISGEEAKKKSYRNIFWVIQAANLGMLFSFPVQGYGPVSISFSTLHILASFLFTYRFLKDAGANPDNSGKHYLSFRFIKAASFFMVLSTLGPLSLGPIIQLTGSGSNLYYNAIYFYLHFQYNGWFSFAVLGLFFWTLENKKNNFSIKQGKLFYTLMLISCIPACLLSFLWTKPHPVVYVTASVAAIVQLAAFFIFLTFLTRIKLQWKEPLSKWEHFLIFFSLFSFGIKVVLQAMTSLPYFADLAYTIRDFTIGYLHLVFIGFITFFLFAFLIRYGELRLSSIGRTGLFLFSSGFVISELILFVQGILIWQAHSLFPYFAPVLFFFSLLVLAGSLFLIINRFKRPGRGFFQPL